MNLTINERRWLASIGLFAIFLIILSMIDYEIKQYYVPKYLIGHVAMKGSCSSASGPIYDIVILPSKEYYRSEDKNQVKPHFKVSRQMFCNLQFGTVYKFTIVDCRLFGPDIVHVEELESMKEY